MEEVFTAWAIDSRSEEEYGLIRYWWFNHKAEIPSHLEGCKFALFKSRALARKNLASVKRCWENARVVKVKVTVEV